MNVVHEAPHGAEVLFCGEDQQHVRGAWESRCCVISARNCVHRNPGIP
jgi:hypothetical protein